MFQGTMAAVMRRRPEAGKLRFPKVTRLPRNRRQSEPDNSRGQHDSLSSRADPREVAMAALLFRPEAVEYQRSRSWAGATAAPPLANWILTAFLAISVVAAAIFLSLGTYANKETVTGYLTPATGVAKLVPATPGAV